MKQKKRKIEKQLKKKLKRSDLNDWKNYIS